MGVVNGVRGQLYLNESPQQKVKVRDNLPELVSSKDMVDDLHLLCV